VNSTILPPAELRHANGHCTLPSSNVTSSSSRDTCNGVVAPGRCHGYQPETVATTPPLDDELSVQYAPTTTTKPQTEYLQHFHQLSDDVTTPSCDVTRPPTTAAAETAASSSLSSFVTSDDVTSSFDTDGDVIDDDVVDYDVMDRDVGTVRGCTGSASLRAVTRLSAVVGQLLALTVDDDDAESSQQTTVERLLRRVLPETAWTTGSILELLDEVIAERGVDAAVKTLLDALTPARVANATDGGHLGHVVEMLRAVELLLELVTSPDAAEVRNCACSCDVMRTDDAAEFDVRMTSLSDCVTDDATLSRRLQRCGDGGRHFRSRQVAPAVDDDDDDFERHQPSLSVRLSGWCLCDQLRTVPLTQLLTGTRSVCELALVKVNLDAGMSSWLAEALRSNTSLVRLDLRLSSLGDVDGAAALGEGLGRHRRLRSLNLAGTGLSDAALRRLLAAFAANRKLIELDVGFNDLSTGSGCLALGDALRTRRPPLRRLRMREDGITWSRSSVAPLFRSAARSARLRCLDVSGNALGDDGVGQLSDALLINRTLRELNVEAVHLGYDGCRALARALRSNDALRSLQISRNDIGDRGFSEVVGALRYNRAVTSLGANQCHVTNAGLAHLLEALRHNVTVTLVKLCYNDIGRHGNGDVVGRDWTTVHATSCSSLQGVKDDVIRDAEPTSCADGNTSTMIRYVRSFSDVTSGVDDDVTPPLSELYASLRQVLHENPRLKILLWGNKMNPCPFESPLSRVKT